MGPGELGIRRDEYQPLVVPTSGTGLAASKSLSDPITPSPSQTPRTPAKVPSDQPTSGMGHHRTSSSVASLAPPPADGVSKDAVTPQSSPAKEESRLRQRLKAAVLGATSTSEHS